MPALDSPLVLCLLVVVVGAGASLLPVSPIEPILIGIAAMAPPWLLLPLVALTTVSHMSTKILVFLGGARLERAFTGRSRERFDRARKRLEGRDRLQQTTLFVSSVAGLPPFYLTTALCGTLHMPVRRFLLLATTGRAIRFSALILSPQLFTPANAAAQTPATAIRSVGSGPQTYVLLSGMVGGTAGFRRIETRLVAQGHRVVSIDPYQLAVDSSNVSFDAMARIVDAELSARGITGARLVGHSHGGGVALRLAANSPRRAAALYLVDVGALPTNRGAVFSSSIRLVPLITRLPHGRAFIRRRIVAGLRDNSIQHGWLDDSTQRAYAEPLLDNIRRVVAMALRLSRADEPESIDAVVARLRVPVSVLVGEIATQAGPTREEFAVLERLGGLLNIERIADAGHFPHEERPDDVVRHLVAPRRVIALIAR